MGHCRVKRLRQIWDYLDSNSESKMNLQQVNIKIQKTSNFGRSSSEYVKKYAVYIELEF